MAAHSDGYGLGIDSAQSCKTRGGRAVERGALVHRSSNMCSMLAVLCDDLHGQAELDLGVESDGDLVDA